MRIGLRRLGKTIFIPGFVLCCGLILLLGLRPPKAMLQPSLQASLQIEDMAGIVHTFAGPPQRIVFTAQVLPTYLSLTEGISAVAGVNAVTRRTIFSGLLDQIYPKAKDIPEVAGGFATPDIEEITRLKPDAVVAWGDQAERLTKPGLLNVITVSLPPPTAQNGIRLLRLLAKLSGQEARADSLVGSYQARMDAVRQALSSQPTRPVRVLILMANPSKLSIGSRNYLDDSLQFVGADNVAHGGLSSAFSVEDVARLDPDVILIQTFSDSLKPQDLFDNPDWQIIRAVQSRKIYRLPNLPLFHVTVFDSLLVQWLAAVLHPDGALGDLRDSFRRTYAEGYHYTVNDADLDTLLNFPANAQSASYDRFAAHTVGAAR
jgi:iron complex transport system substrate-binding protein